MTDAVEEGLARLSGDAGLRALDARALRPRVRPAPCSARTSTRPAPTRRPTRCARRCAATPARRCPADPLEQLRAAVLAVFRSWSSRRAMAYRRHWGISEDGGTAVVVQAMVFGNLGDGLRHRRALHPRPADGRARAVRRLAAGRARARTSSRGTHDPLPLAAFRDELPEAHDRLHRGRAGCSSASTATCRTSSSPSSAAASTCCRRAPPSARRWPRCGPPSSSPTRARSTATTALARVTPEQLERVLAPLLPEEVDGGRGGRRARHAGLPRRRVGPRRRRTPTTRSSPTTTSSSRGRRRARRTSAGMIGARAVVTERGGATSHAAVVTRALGRPSVVGRRRERHRRLDGAPR